MEKERNTKIMVMAALIVAILGLSLGFAAFSNTLVIKPQASVNPDSSNFKVHFSKTAAPNFSAADVEPTIPNGSTATAEDAEIDNTGTNPIISGLDVTFTQPGQTVSYTFYAYNRGQYTAYLRSLTFENATGGSPKVCAAGTDTGGNTTTSSLVTAACNDITLTVTIAGEDPIAIPAATSTISSFTNNHSLAVNASEQITVTISYANNGHYVDGPFTIRFGDIKLTYSTVAGSVAVPTPQTYDATDLAYTNALSTENCADVACSLDELYAKLH